MTFKFFILQVSSVSGVIEVSWIVTSASAGSLLLSVVRVEGSEGNLVSHRCVVAKERDVLIVIFR